MRLGYDITIEQSQKLVMTPELIQAIQILQFNTQELDSYVQEQLLTNPVLENEISSNQEGEKSKEEKNDDSINEYIKERGYDDISYRQGDYIKNNQETSFENYVSADVTLSEHLMFQLQFASSKKGCRKIGKYIIEALDENGYLTLSPVEIAEKLGTKEEIVYKVLNIIHSFDPPGVGAENLAQCLLIQLDTIGEKTADFEKVLMDHIEDLADNRLNVISKSLGLPVEEVQEMADVIKSLDPRPGRQFASQDETRYIVPDVLVENIDGEYIVTINDNSVPRLMVSSYYEKVLAQAGSDSKLTDYLNDRLNSAIWLIKSIEQRKQTILNVVKTIVTYQKDFFDKGDKFLKTLTLKQIAEELGIHESTVSRSINGKYMQSPRGVYELKFFFSAGVLDHSGEGGISSNSIKTHIKEIIEGENEKKPYSDQVIVKMLSTRDIDISRRTVAKYRDELGILSSSKRKRY